MQPQPQGLLAALRQVEPGSPAVRLPWGPAAGQEQALRKTIQEKEAEGGRACPACQVLENPPIPAARFRSRSTVWSTCTIPLRIFEEPIPMHRLLEQVYRSEVWLRQIQQRMQRQRLLRLETMRIRQHPIHRQHRLTRAFHRILQRLRIQALQMLQ